MKLPFSEDSKTYVLMCCKLSYRLAGVPLPRLLFLLFLLSLSLQLDRLPLSVVMKKSFLIYARLLCFFIASAVVEAGTTRLIVASLWPPSFLPLRVVRKSILGALAAVGLTHLALGLCIYSLKVIRLRTATFWLNFCTRSHP